MSTLITTTPSTATEYQARFPRSMALWERARHLIPSGINHDARRIVPFPLYMDRAQGCRKWDTEGDIDDAVGRFARALRRVTREGLLAPGR
jgi:glutamate-1-semialdehyde 2,1-aminomutase